jgi:3-oxoacyl-[acyl-carrier-protein] synthase I
VVSRAGLNVLGIGARTSLGFDLVSSAAAARARLSAFAEHPFMIDQTGRPMVVARDPWLPPELEREQRLAQLAASAAADSLAGILASATGRRLPVALFLALPEFFPADDGSRVARLEEAIMEELGDRVELLGAQAMELGHTAGVAAVQGVARAIRDGLDGLSLVLGVDSWLNPLMLEWLDDTKRLHSSAQPFGFVPSEAAASVVIGGGRFANATASKAWIAGAGRSREVELPPEQPHLGLALTKAARDILHSLETQEQVAETVIVDLNGIPERADEVGYTLVRLSERLAPNFETTAPAEWFGDVGAASIPLMVGLAAAAAEKGYSKGGTALLLAQSVGTERGALLLHLPQRSQM